MKDVDLIPPFNRMLLEVTFGKLYAWAVQNIRNILMDANAKFKELGESKRTCWFSAALKSLQEGPSGHMSGCHGVAPGCGYGHLQVPMFALGQTSVPWHVRTVTSCCMLSQMRKRTSRIGQKIVL